MAQGEDGVIPGGDELLGDVAFVTGFEDLTHDGWVVDFLSVVDFCPARISCGVVMRYVLVIVADAPDDVAVHDRDVVDIEEQFEVFRAHAFDEVYAEVDVIAEVARMPHHWLGAVAGVKMFEGEGDALFLSQGQNFFPSVDAALGGFFIIHAVVAHAGEGDDVFATDVSGDVNSIGEGLNDFVVKLRVAGTFFKTVAADQ